MNKELLITANDLSFIELNIRNLLKTNKVEAKKMCLECGIVEQTLYRNFREHNYQLSTLKKIADYFKVPLSDLLANETPVFNSESSKMRVSNEPLTKYGSKKFNEKQQAKFDHLMSTIDQAAEKIKNDIIRFIE